MIKPMTVREIIELLEKCDPNALFEFQQDGTGSVVKSIAINETRKIEQDIDYPVIVKVTGEYTRTK